MPDRTPPTYRFWGQQKPIAFAAVTDTAAKTGSKAAMRIYGPIDSWGAPFGVSADEFGQALASLGEDVETIELHMHSPGGEVFEGLAIMNQLRQHPAAVNLVIDGLAASIASVIAMGADTVAMGPGAQMMVHDASGICIGTAEDMTTMTTRLESLSSNIADIYAARAGGTAEDWRAAMQPESWYKAQEAVDAGLADRVLTADEAPAQPRATFDLSMFAHAGREQAPAPFMPTAGKDDDCGATSCEIYLNGKPIAKAVTQTPAEQPVVPSTETEEADTMSDTISKAGLCKALGLADDADEDTILDAIDKRTEAAAQAANDKGSATVDIAAVTTALEADGKVVVSKARFDALEVQAAEGAEARAKQITDERNELIEAAMSAGKISRSDQTRAVWEGEFARNFDTAKADLESLPARFPVGQTVGVQGHDGSAGTDAAFTDEEAGALAQLAGISKEGLLR